MTLHKRWLDVLPNDAILQRLLEVCNSSQKMQVGSYSPAGLKDLSNKNCNLEPPSLAGISRSGTSLQTKSKMMREGSLHLTYVKFQGLQLGKR